MAFHHGYTAVDAKMRIYNQLDWWSLRTANQVFTSSAAFVEELERKNVQPDHIHVQHMPIRPFAPVSEKAKNGIAAASSARTNGRAYCCASGAFHGKGPCGPHPGISENRELAGDSPLRLVLVGEGPERPANRRALPQIESGRFGDPCRPAGRHQPILRHCRCVSCCLRTVKDVRTSCSKPWQPASRWWQPPWAEFPEVVTSGRDAILVKKHDPAALASATARILEGPGLRDRHGFICSRDCCPENSRSLFQVDRFRFQSGMRQWQLIHLDRQESADGRVLLRYYWKVERVLAPGLRYSQDSYEEVLREMVTSCTVWLDLGCGHGCFQSGDSKPNAS